ncbi:MAG: EF-P beta-lysylation protein EpmB [Gammaproteobacteria bacterium]|nr:EF-P beta-lysylation protein EpmB [Gammaproteobacteria bacterium]MDH5659866.1 EF-P beta-lysylation protein EpmB [Gammaproteobacteria bacterium]
MIPRTVPPCQSDDTPLAQTGCSSSHWQTALADAIRQPAELLEYLNLPQSLLSGAIAASESFTLRVPRGYCQRIEKGNPDDPLLRQVLPLDAELIHDQQFMHDPVGDLAAMEAPSLLHKYQGRVLIITTPVCAVHCRYCFRRHFPYQENRAEQNWNKTVDYIRNHSDIHEVILSGGDPLSLTESRLKNLTDKLINIPHIKTLRLHTRQPIVLPERVNNELLSWIDSLPWKIVVVLHCNHANEIAPPVAFALKQLQQHQVTLLNQSVLLAGVNDDTEVLVNLSQKLFEHHVLPYYLHRLDKVQGAKHFYVENDKASQLINKVRQRLPGYLVPKLVEERAGEKSKTAII